MLKKLHAGLVVTQVFDGDRGTGFSLTLDPRKLPQTPQLGRDVARSLRAMADQIEQDFAGH